MRHIRLLCAVFALILALGVSAPAEEDSFFSLRNDATALEALKDYVSAVTDPGSPDFIPECDRIAVFDLDGTLISETSPVCIEKYLLAYRILLDESYQPDGDMLEYGRALRDHAAERSFPEGVEEQQAERAAEAYSGMTINEFRDFVAGALLHEADGFTGMTYAEAFFLPMVEVIDYLRENGFDCYIVSGSDRFVCRALIEGVMDIPPENIIGLDVRLAAAGQEGADALGYVFTPGDNVVRTDDILLHNTKTNKVLQIAQEIGRRPVLSFGNSWGDVSMHNYALSNDSYRSMAFMVLADDDARDYGDPERSEELRDEWEKAGYQVISMADDWKTVYGDDVVKTGGFNWKAMLAEERVPIDDPAETEAAPEAEQSIEEDVQYVLYLGTNGKDTNMPVFTEQEAMEKAQEILIKHFGGYTIQEARGGWIDGDSVYQEYTLVIYLSGAAEEDVHAAADELIEVFNQSSILIQKNPTTTEFYSGE